MLNKQKGNMYGFVTHTWNVVKGKCIHDCVYCYMKRFPQKDLWFDVSELKVNLGDDKFIFVGSSTDMFASNVSSDWIKKVLFVCKSFTNNKYLFQTKNPHRFLEFADLFPINSVLCVTIESNKSNDDVNCADSPSMRVRYLEVLLDNYIFPIHITIEPVMDFDISEFLYLLKKCSPSQINIGADSNRSRTYVYPEPSKEKLSLLITELKKFSVVYEKNNLKRLIK